MVVYKPSLMNQPPFFWNHRLSTLVIVYVPRRNSVLTNQIAEVQSGDELGGSKELHFAQRIWIIITHALRMVNTSYIEAATKHKQGKQGSLGTDLAPQQNTSRERCLRLVICITIRKYVWA